MIDSKKQNLFKTIDEYFGKFDLEQYRVRIETILRDLSANLKEISKTKDEFIRFSGTYRLDELETKMKNDVKSFGDKHNAANAAKNDLESLLKQFHDIEIEKKHEIEQNERLFNDGGFYLSSDSESDNDGEKDSTSKTYPKTCGRQDNVMPNSRLSDNLEDINCELMKRVDSNASSYQPSPKLTRRLLSSSESKVSSEDLKEFYPTSPTNSP